MNLEKFAEAIDSETGKINWDCPCLEEIQSLPCKDEFKKAFECYVKSAENGKECVSEFHSLQKCYSDNDQLILLKLQDNFSDDLISPAPRKKIE